MMKDETKNLLASLPPLEWSQIADPRMGSLTLREISILVLVHLDNPDKEIADELKISPHTLRIHLTNIRKKIGVRSRVGMAVFVERNFWHSANWLRRIARNS